MSTMIFKEEEILMLCSVDAELIIKAYGVSDTLGSSAIKNSIAEFSNEIHKHKGTFVPALDLDYRFYIVNLLRLACDTVDDNLKTKIFSEVLVPS